MYNLTCNIFCTDVFHILSEAAKTAVQQKKAVELCTLGMSIYPQHEESEGSKSILCVIQNFSACEKNEDECVNNFYVFLIQISLVNQIDQSHL